MVTKASPAQHPLIEFAQMPRSLVIRFSRCDGVRLNLVGTRSVPRADHRPEAPHRIFLTTRAIEAIVTIDSVGSRAFRSRRLLVKEAERDLPRGR
jgi:hypothetical protein